jgi:hypothetical protein
VGSISATNGTGYTQYKYIDSSSLNSSAYYRLKIVNAAGAFNYSNTIHIKQEEKPEDKLTILKNPVSHNVLFNYSSPDNRPRAISIYNSNGIKVHSVMLNTKKGNNTYSISLDPRLGNGIYFIALTTGKENLTSKFIKQ